MKKIISLAFLMFSASVSANQVMSHWQFNGDLLDTSNYRNHMSTTVGNIAFEGGANDLGISFNGVDSAVAQASNGSWYFGPGSFAVSFWVKPQAGNTDAYIVNRRGTGNEGAQAGFALGITDVGGGQFGFTALMDDGTGNSVGCEGCGYVYDYDQWYHVVMDYTGAIMRVWINGNKLTTQSTTGLGSIDNELPVEVGGTNYQDGVFGQTQMRFKGAVDELKAYSGGLSEALVAGIYNTELQSRAVSRLGNVQLSAPGGQAWATGTIYQAETDGFIMTRLGGSRCDENGVTNSVGTDASALTYVGRISGYNSNTIPVAKGEFWLVDHYKKVSSCNVEIIFRPMF